MNFNNEYIQNMSSARDHDLEGLNILFVEDSEDNQQLVGAYLRGEGTHLDFAQNGLEGIEKAMSSEYDVVLMDIQMPVLDGHVATKRLRRCGYKKPIIALTANAQVAEKESALKNGFNEYLTKPISRRTLLNTLRHYTHNA